MVDYMSDDNMDAQVELQEFQGLKRKYMRVFNSDDGKGVLEDLRIVCKYDLQVNNELEEGMRRVYLHIKAMISGEGMVEVDESEEG